MSTTSNQSMSRSSSFNDNDPMRHEPTMHVPRPSSDRAQDVSHILASVFQDVYTRDVFSKNTVNNLLQASDGSSEFHKECMKQLDEIHKSHQSALQQFDEVEKQIIQARARAVSADTRALSHKAGDIGTDNYRKLGLPPVDSHFRWCLEQEKLKSFNLITPSALFPQKPTISKGNRLRRKPHYMDPTVSSSVYFSKEKTDTGYIDDDDFFDSNDRRESSLEFNDNQSVTTLSSDSDNITHIPPETPILKKVRSPSHTKKNRWRENMGHMSRIEDKEILARLDEKQNFLRNPRFLPISEAKAARLLITDQPKIIVLKGGQHIMQRVPNVDVQVFQSSPDVVLFSDWHVGRVYELSLDLRNISTVSRQLKVLPPKSSYFSLGLGKYPNSEGTVAPGMSAQYSVRFMPDSLADYSDEVVVVSQAASPMIVKVKAQRPVPMLTIGDTINCGFCLKRGIKYVEFPVGNLGGNGRFCLLKKSLWPAANFKTIVNPSCLDLGVFQIRPAVFEVNNGQSITLEIIFAPDDTKLYKEELIVVCDNCQVKCVTIEGQGQTAAVELVSVSDGGDEGPTLGEVADITADHLIRFPPLNPRTFILKQLIVHNSTNVDLPYAWHALKPNLGIVSPNDETIAEDLQFYPDEESVFFIEPQAGTLQPNAIHEFVVTFAPSSINMYNSVLHLVLSGIPDPGDNQVTALNGKTPQIEGIGKPNAESKVARTLSLQEVIALELDVKGECIPFNLVLHPAAIIIPEKTLVGTTVRRPLQMANYSLSPVHFKWDIETDPDIVSIEPAMGVINPGELAEVDVTITGLKIGPLNCNMTCHIENQDAPLSLPISADIKGPDVEICNTAIDFGLVRLTTTVKQEVVIRNLTQCNAKWSLSVLDDKFGSQFKFVSSKRVKTPNQGALGPLDSHSVYLSFTPSQCCSLNSILQLDVEGGNTSNIAIKAEVQTPQACFADSIVVMKDSFISVPKSSNVTLINQTLYETTYNFLDIKGKDSDACEVTVYPSKGTLGSREELKIAVTLLCHKEGDITDLFLPCKIGGMSEPIVLGFYASVKNLSVQFNSAKSNVSSSMIQFPTPVSLGSVTTASLSVKNLTAIRAPWRAVMKNFMVKLEKPRKPPSIGTGHRLLARTPNLSDPLAKSGKQSAKEKCSHILREGNGLAFTITPESGMLEPYQEQDIVITAYSDMWGNYKDTFECYIEGLEVFRFPVEVDIVGCPLSFQVANNREGNTVVRYGTHLDGGPYVNRKLRINNNGPCDVRLDWRMYNYPENDDLELIDLNVWFGDAFPLEGQYDYDPSVDEDAEAHELVIPEDFDAPDIVHVRLEPHVGIRSDKPYKMNPSQLVVPARGQAYVNSILQPSFGKSRNGETQKECLAYGLGFMSLTSDQLSNQDKSITRGDEYSVDPLRIEVTSIVRCGNILIESDDEDFHIPLSNLTSKSTQCQLFSYTLNNHTETNLLFDVLVREPFFLLSNRQRVSCLPGVKLPPQTNVKVDIGFRISNETLSDLATVREHCTEPEVLKLVKDDLGAEKLVYTDVFTMKYSNGAVQYHPIRGFVSVPSFNVPLDFIDFGLCFVGQSVTKEFTITNPSCSDSFWKFDESVLDVGTGTFKVEPSCGVLQAFVSHKTRNKETLSVTFTASDESPVEGTLVIRGKLGEAAHTLRVVGQGSYDGKYEVK